MVASNPSAQAPQEAEPTTSASALDQANIDTAASSHSQPPPSLTVPSHGAHNGSPENATSLSHQPSQSNVSEFSAPGKPSETESIAAPEPANPSPEHEDAAPSADCPQQISKTHPGLSSSSSTGDEFPQQKSPAHPATFNQETRSQFSPSDIANEPENASGPYHHYPGQNTDALHPSAASPQPAANTQRPDSLMNQTNSLSSNAFNEPSKAVPLDPSHTIGGMMADPNLDPDQSSEYSSVVLNILGTTFKLRLPTRLQKVEVKLFVGRLPRNFDETQLTPLFATYGEVIESVIIRDKATGMHKGSAFVKMLSLTEADAAVRALHGIKVIDQQLGPIQVKYATGEPERLGLTMDAAQAGHDLGKLFVGSLPRIISEQELRAVFETFGQVEEIVMIKDNNTGQLKGCAFVKFTLKEQAIQAIRCLHGQVKLPTCPRPLEVKFAENRRSALVPAPAVMGMNPSAYGMPSHMPHGGYMMKQQQVSMSQSAMGGMVACEPMRNGMGNSRNQHALATAAMPHPQAMTPSNLNPRTVNGWTEYFTTDGRPYYHHMVTKITQWTRPIEFNRVPPYMMQPNLANAQGSYHNQSGATPGQTSSSAGMAMNMGQMSTPSQSSSDMSGPSGANVFVFHIPSEWGQNDVIQNFSQFGRVLSCYVATDRVTGRNKGYGFISYDEIQSAVNAVMGMNGFPVGTKRLKVSIKAGEESYAGPLLRAAQQQQQQQQLASQTSTNATPPMMVSNQANFNATLPAAGGNSYAPMGYFHPGMGNASPNPTNTGGMASTMGAYRAAPY